jgi:hypothetical protein
MPHNCLECVREKHLKALNENEKRLLMCSNCAEELTCIDVENRNFCQFVKALVRFNYSEWEYNSHRDEDESFFMAMKIYFCAR